MEINLEVRTLQVFTGNTGVYQFIDSVQCKLIDIKQTLTFIVSVSL